MTPPPREATPADGRKVKGATIHWVEADTAADAEVRLYHYLFTDPAPDGPDKNFLDYLNPDSLQVLTGCKVEQGWPRPPCPKRVRPPRPISLCARATSAWIIRTLRRATWSLTGVFP